MEMLGNPLSTPSTHMPGFTFSELCFAVVGKKNKIKRQKKKKITNPQNHIFIKELSSRWVPEGCSGSMDFVPASAITFQTNTACCLSGFLLAAPSSWLIALLLGGGRRDSAPRAGCQTPSRHLPTATAPQPFPWVTSSRSTRCWVIIPRIYLFHA